LPSSRKLANIATIHKVVDGLIHGREEQAY